MNYFNDIISNTETGATIIVNNKHTDFWDPIIDELNKFRWSSKTAVRLLQTKDLHNSEDLLKEIVPLVEKKEFIMAIGHDDELSQELLKAYRYLENAFIFNSVSNDFTLLSNLYEYYDDKLNLETKKYSKLVRYDQIGLQWHMIDHENYYLLEDCGSRFLRLGKLKENITGSESIIRDANFIHFDTNVLKHSEYPARTSNSQSGISSEEACQIARYAGISDKSQVFSICGYDNNLDIHGRSANVLAQLCWYALDGFLNRKKDFPVQSEHLIRYVIDDEEDLINLTFLKSNRSTRWWIEGPDEIKTKMGEHSLYACSYDDYLSAVSKEPSDTIIKARLWFDHVISAK